MKQDVVITYTEGNKNKQFKLLRGIQYNAKPREHDLEDGATKVLREDPAGKPADPFEIIVKGKTKEPDTYLCDVYKVYVSGNQPKRIPQKNVEIKFYKSEGYTPEERKPEEPKSQFK